MNIEEVKQIFGNLRSDSQKKSNKNSLIILLIATTAIIGIAIYLNNKKDLQIRE
jgi:hypothetical protein